MVKKIASRSFLKVRQIIKFTDGLEDNQGAF